MTPSVVHIAFVNGPEDGKEVRRPSPLIFGRLTDNAVPLPYDTMSSRLHARLSCDENGFTLEDLGSRNGTFLLTGEPLHGPVRLEPGALFRVGGTWFRLIGS